jgi:hypothetical protein
MNRASMLVTGQFQLFQIENIISIGAEDFCADYYPEELHVVADRGSQIWVNVP